MRDARPDDHRRALQALVEYVRLQQKLLAAWSDHLGVVPGKSLLSAPRSGELDVGDSRWRWHRHGGGVCFTQAASGVVVDVEEHLDEPEMFTVWRLAGHFGSMKRRGLKMIERVTDDYESPLDTRIQRWLEELEKQRVVVRDDRWWRMSRTLD